jgi:hypothetical protein
LLRQYLLTIYGCELRDKRLLSLDSLFVLKASKNLILRD